MKFLSVKLFPLFSVAFFLLFCGGCKTTESYNINGETEYLYIYSVFKSKWNNYPIHGTLSLKDLELLNKKGVEYYMDSNKTPFEENLHKIILEVSKSKAIYNEKVKPPFSVLLYTEKKLREITLDEAQKRLLGRNKMYKLTQQLELYTVINDTDEPELVGQIFINFNTCDQDSLGNTEKYNEIYDRALNFIGRNTNKQVGLKYTYGIGISEPILIGD